MIQKMILRFSAADLLSSIWYYDGSGARCGVDSSLLPGDFDLDTIWVEDVVGGGSDVVLTLVDKKYEQAAR